MAKSDEETCCSLVNNVIAKNLLKAADNVERSMRECVEKSPNITVISPSEIIEGPVIGEGSFGRVRSVREFRPRNSFASEGSKRGFGKDEISSEEPDRSSEVSRCSLTDQRRRYSRKGETSFRTLRSWNMELEPENYVTKYNRYSSGNLLSAVDSSISIGKEASLLMKLSHSNVVEIFGISSKSILSSSFFLLLEYIPEQLEDRWNEWRRQRTFIFNFRRFIGKRKSDSRIDQAMNVAKGLLNGLIYLHENGVIYRDLKRENIGFGVSGEVKIFDFGLSRDIGTSAMYKEDLRLTNRVGTPRYMAPEILQGKNYNGKVDVYSFGILFWELFALENAFEGHTLRNHYRMMTSEHKRPPMIKWLPKQFQQLIDSCWHGDPRRRPTMRSIFVTINSITNF